ncbi:YhcG family protein [Cesiribacter sp. SM1]|uniref:PDDEXK nuclease domain-containing protein n=1 Tax=Cesiribacter sp. SM1 TaxID=2861196 RepID=UPI001CD4F897|nr:PDDEXK nuclease domain-containing protein [Cesiribacter sp. SM1]
MKANLSKTLQSDFSGIVTEIRTAQQKALQQVNQELVLLYWRIGQRISERLQSAVWGEGVVDQLAAYIKEQAPELKGFTRRGLYRMRQFYEAYAEDKKVSTLLTQLPWTAHLHLLSKTSSAEERQFYLQLAIKEKYSVRELERQIDSGYYERYMLAKGRQEAFVSTAMAQIHPNSPGAFLDTYVLDFLDLPQLHSEQDFQQSIVSNLKNFILEAGRDFSFVGQNYRLQVGDKDFYIDLLFYHRGLQSLVAFELKITEFKPEYIGQLDFYLEALDREVKKEHEKPSIGVLLCKSKNDEIVKFSLSRSLSPTLIAQYETALIDKNLLKQKLHEFYELEQLKEKDE